MKRHGSFRVMAVAVLVIAAGCVPEFKYPLPAGKDLQADPELLGSWSQKEKTGSENQVLFYARAKGWLDVVHLMDVNSAGRDSGLDFALYEGYSTQIKGEKFLSLRARQKDWADRRDAPSEYNYLLVRYRVVSNENLEINVFSEDKVGALVRAGVISGSAGTTGAVDSVKVISSSDYLKAVIEERPLSDFIDETDTMLFRRIGSAAP